MAAVQKSADSEGRSRARHASTSKLPRPRKLNISLAAVPGTAPEMRYSAASAKAKATDAAISEIRGDRTPRIKKMPAAANGKNSESTNRKIQNAAKRETRTPS